MKIELYYQDQEGDCHELKIGGKYNVTLKATSDTHIWVYQFGVSIYSYWLDDGKSIMVDYHYPRTQMGLYILSQDDMTAIRKLFNKVVFDKLGFKYDNSCR